MDFSAKPTKTDGQTADRQTVREINKWVDRLNRRFIYTYAHTDIHTYTHTHAHTHICTNTHMHKYTHICTNTHTHMHKYTHIYTYTDIHTHRYAHTHTHTHMHTHTCISYYIKKYASSDGQIESEKVGVLVQIRSNSQANR